MIEELRERPAIVNASRGKGLDYISNKYCVSENYQYGIMVVGGCIMTIAEKVIAFLQGEGQERSATTA